MRPEILFPLFAPSSSLKGVGPKLAPLLDRVAGPLVRDVAFTLPQDLIQRRRTTTADAVDGLHQTFVVRIDKHLPGHGTSPYKIRCLDEAGFIFLIFFKVFGDHLLRQHPPGAPRVVSGKAERYPFTGELQMNHPDYFLDAAKVGEIPASEAVYPGATGLASRTVRKFALEAVAKAAPLPEWLDPAWRLRESWPHWREALANVHAPEDQGDLSPLTPARRRLAYDELLAHQLALAQRKAGRRAQAAAVIPAGPIADRIESVLPYRLTGAQVRALSEVRGDLQSGQRMSRLLQGDVGAGKTVVAMLAMADVAAAGSVSRAAGGRRR